MFFISDEKNDNRDIYKVLNEELSRDLIIKPKVTPIVSTNEKTNIDIRFTKKKINTNKKLFSIKVNCKTTIKSQEWHHS